MIQPAEITLHDEYVQSAFDAVLAAESILTDVDGRLSKAVAILKTEKAIAESALDKAWKALSDLMEETGETEVLLPSDGATWNKIYYTAPRESLKVDEDAVPDEFCKIERKPKLNEIKEYLKCRDDLPNWAHLEIGKSKLAWKNVKRSKVNE